MNRCLYCYKPLEDGLYHKQCSRSFFGSDEPPELVYGLDEMGELAKHIVERRITVPGAQPKLSLSLVEKSLDEAKDRLTVIGALGGQFILKPPTENYPEIPENEHLTMRMAEDFGIPTVSSNLIPLQSGELSYITKRIDRREGGEKIHMLDMFQILEGYDKYKGSMEKIGKAIGKYSENTLLDKLYFFEISLFSFLTGNNDMHLKNFSLILSDIGWKLAPAYDLLNASIVNPEDKEEMALPIQGRKRKLKRDDFISLAKGLELTSKQIQGVFDRFYEFKAPAHLWVDRSFLSKEMKDKYKELLKERFSRLGM